MFNFNADALTKALLPAVLEAARIEMAYYRGTVAVEVKADQSPVTAADQDAEKVLIAALEKAAPGIAIVAEESRAAGHRPDIGSTFFLVDPLDGTKEFVKKSGDFTINIGLVDAGRPIYGLIFVPAMQELYVTRSQGAACAQIALDATDVRLNTIALQPIATRSSPKDGLVALESRSHRTAATEDFLKTLAIREVRQAGSSLKFCLIACGQADVYPRLGPTSEWDTAAAHAILNAAGGAVLTLDGLPLIYGKSDQEFLNPSFVAWGRAPGQPNG